MGKDGERKGEKHRCERETLMVVFCVHPDRDWTHNPGMGPDWELNRWPSALQDDTQTT